MNPILSEIFLKPVGWLAIGGSIVMVMIGLAIRAFIRKQMREEDRSGRRD